MSKKSHRRQAKPAAVQAYPVSDALGDVPSRAWDEGTYFGPVNSRV